MAIIDLWRVAVELEGACGSKDVPLVGVVESISSMGDGGLVPYVYFEADWIY